MTITTPSTFPLSLPNLSSTSSGTFLFIPLKCLAQECDSITGASVRSNAWRAVWSDTCERSMKMPSRFISGMSSLPRGLVYCGERKQGKAKSKSSKITREGWGEVIIVSSITIAGCHVDPRTMSEAEKKKTYESPPQRCSTSSKTPAESANALLQLCVRVMYLTPSW